jgi:excisionase family DNA binding protein
MERLLTVKDVSDKLRVGKSTVYRWVHYEYIPHVKLGTSVRFNERTIERWLRNKERSGKNELRIDVTLRE